MMSSVGMLMAYPAVNWQHCGTQQISFWSIKHA